MGYYGKRACCYGFVKKEEIVRRWRNASSGDLRLGIVGVYSVCVCVCVCVCMCVCNESLVDCTQRTRANRGN